MLVRRRHETALLERAGGLTDSAAKSPSERGGIGVAEPVGDLAHRQLSSREQALGAADPDLVEQLPIRGSLVAEVTLQASRARAELLADRLEVGLASGIAVGERAKGARNPIGSGGWLLEIALGRGLEIPAQMRVGARQTELEIAHVDEHAGVVFTEAHRAAEYTLRCLHPRDLRVLKEDLARGPHLADGAPHQRDEVRNQELCGVSEADLLRQEALSHGYAVLRAVEPNGGSRMGELLVPVDQLQEVAQRACVLDEVSKDAERFGADLLAVANRQGRILDERTDRSPQGQTLLPWNTAIGRLKIVGPQPGLGEEGLPVSARANAELDNPCDTPCR
ncbi:MAG: hypothetical protein R3F14_41950 [Polyangiaceae bacterium]